MSEYDDILVLRNTGMWSNGLIPAWAKEAAARYGVDAAHPVVIRSGLLDEIKSQRYAAIVNRLAVEQLTAEIERLRLLIRCETIQPPADVTDDCTTELAVELAEAKAEIERLKEQLPTVVKIAVEHAHNGHNPGIYWRGNVWRYHLDLMCNQWADNPDPVKAAQGEYVEGRGRDE